jgi:hypothetical protein
MPLETGVARLTNLLEDISWPTALVWVSHDQVLCRPLRGTTVFRPVPDVEAERKAPAVFNEQYGTAPEVLFDAVGHDAGRTYALVEAIEEPAQGEAGMFISDGLKISARRDGGGTQVIRSRALWLIRRALHRRWERKTARAVSAV